jgi:hypothetical protein
MKLTPFDITEEAKVEQVIADLLPRDASEDEELSHIQQVFKLRGAGVEDAAKTVSTLMRNAKREETKLRAAEMALKVQGVYANEKEKHIPTVVINIMGSGGENKNLINLVMPVV